MRLPRNPLISPSGPLWGVILPLLQFVCAPLLCIKNIPNQPFVVQRYNNPIPSLHRSAFCFLKGCCPFQRLIGVMISPVEHWPSQVDHQQISTNSFPQMLWPIPKLTTCRISKDCCRPRSRMAPRAWLLLFAAMLPVIFGKVGEDNSANISDICLDHNAYITLKKNSQ